MLGMMEADEAILIMPLSLTASELQIGLASEAIANRFPVPVWVHDLMSSGSMLNIMAAHEMSSDALLREFVCTSSSLASSFSLVPSTYVHADRSLLTIAAADLSNNGQALCPS